MSDVFSEAKRSEIMSRIRSRGNRDTEIAFMTLLRRHRISGWRRHRQLRLTRLAGGERETSSGCCARVRPDFVFSALKLAVFVDGCFWHWCPRHGAIPKANEAFWREKLSGNRARDQFVNRALRLNGWRVTRVWEHELSRNERLAARLKRIIEGRRDSIA
jgi:DNA mismatch endonuclease (patch repair protein)